MDGSIADSTALRMRTQLQRLHHSSPTSQPDGFLEELLKMPAAPVVEQSDDAQPVEATLDSSPTSTTSQANSDKSNSDKEPAEKDEPVDNTLAAPCIPLCYGPASMPVPQTAEPEVDVEATVAVTEPTVAPTAVAQEQVAQPVTVTETSPVVDNVEVATVDTEVTADEFVPPVESNAQPLVKDNQAKTVRDIRRTKDVRDKSESPIERPQVPAKQPTPVTETSPDVEAKATKDGQLVTEPTPVVDASATVRPQDVGDGKPTRDVDRSQRDKWYEKPSASVGDELEASAANETNDLLGDQANNARQDATVAAENVSVVNATEFDAGSMLTDASAQATADSSQMASDMLAAVQANAAQSAATQSVTESSSVANVDSTRGRSSAPSSVVSVGATGAARGSASASSAAASSQESPDAPRELSQQERVRLVQRVARSFSRLGPEGGQVTLKLHPPQLGVLNVSIKIEGQTMTARLQTETGAARDAIVENLSVLRDRLSEQGIEIEKFQVEVGQQDDLASGGGQAGNFTGHDGNSQQSHSSAASEFDYRRAARVNASRQNIAAPMILEPKLQSWSAPGRSLDVRA